MSKSMRFAAWLMILIGGGTVVRGETVSGTVLSSDGTPASGARVWLAKLSTQQLERVEATTDGQGRFSIKVGPGQWLVEAVLDDQSLGQMDFIGVETGRTVVPRTLHLTPQGRLRGRLIEAETGRPIVGGRFVIDDGRDPISDKDGRFEVPGLSRARSHEAFVVAPSRERKRVLFEMSEGPTTDLELRIPRGGKITGRVLDLDGKPIAGAAVGRMTSGSILSLTGLWEHTDVQGNFVYDGLVLDRTTWLNAEAPGFTGENRSDVQLDSGGVAKPIEFRLARRPVAPPPQGQVGNVLAKAAAALLGAPSRRSVTGVVLGPDKKPIANAKVQWDSPRGSDSIEAKTDAEGKFRLAPVPSEPNTVWAVPESAELAPALVRVAAGGDQEVQITLAKGHAVKGVAQDDKGAPFAGVMVLPVVENGSRSLPLWERKATTDEQGRFVVSGLPAEGVKFTFLREGVSDLRDHNLDLDKENVVVMSAAGAIRGKVVDVDGKPVRNFRVLLNISRERKPDDKYGGFFAGYCGIGLSYSSDDGSFLIRNLGAHSVQRVTVIAPGHGEATIDRVIAEPLNRMTPDKAPTFFLKKPFTLRVHAVNDATGEPIAGARVALLYEDPSVDKQFAWGYHDSAWGDSVHAHSNDEGVADFTPLVFGEGAIVVRASGFCRRVLGWRDGAADVTVRLAPEASISGELIQAATGKPIEEAVVHLMSRQGGQMSASVSAADAGRFHIGELPAGTYSLSVNSPSGSNLLNEQVEIKAGQHETRTLRLAPNQIAPAPTPVKPAAKLLKIGEAAPEFTAKTLDDKPIALKDFRGKYVLLDFWATWCGPCVAEIPHLKAVHEAFGDDPKFAMISLSLDPSKDDVAKFLKDKKQPWTQVFLGDWSKDEVTKKYGVELIPTIILLDPEGKIVAQDLRGEEVKKAVAKALKRD
jgi:thiol-disulfide isomerase/thioredoxin